MLLTWETSSPGRGEEDKWLFCMTLVHLNTQVATP